MQSVSTCHGRKLHELMAHIGRPLRRRLEVALPPRAGIPEQRAWDAMIFGSDADMGVELEMRLYDMQAQLRRILLKWRDSGADRMLLLIADTQANRHALRTYPDYLRGLPRTRTATLWRTLERGQLPPTGCALI